VPTASIIARPDARVPARARRALVGLRQPVALAATVLVLAGPGCASPEPGGPGPAATVAPGDQRLVDAVAALCAARREAAGAVPAARGIFYDRSHDAMHELARRAQAADREVTARLLEAKNKVEQDFLYPRTWQLLGDDLARLDEAARAALGVLKIPTPAPCGT
jgi:hypothetical protein